MPSTEIAELCSLQSSLSLMVSLSNHAQCTTVRMPAQTTVLMQLREENRNALDAETKLLVDDVEEDKNHG